MPNNGMAILTDLFSGLRLNKDFSLEEGKRILSNAPFFLCHRIHMAITVPRLNSFSLLLLSSVESDVFPAVISFFVCTITGRLLSGNVAINVACDVT